MSKDWEINNNTVSPVWNNGYQRYDLSMDDVINKLKSMGYNLELLNEESEEDEFADYSLEIHSNKGVVVTEDTALVLQPKVYKNGEDITAKLDEKYFKWVRSSTDAASDAEWNLRHASGIKNLNITHEDVWKRAIFHCALLSGVAENNFVTNMYIAYQASIKH